MHGPTTGMRGACMEASYKCTMSTCVLLSPPVHVQPSGWLVKSVASQLVHALPTVRI